MMFGILLSILWLVVFLIPGYVLADFLKNLKPSEKLALSFLLSLSLYSSYSLLSSLIGIPISPFFIILPALITPVIATYKFGWKPNLDFKDPVFVPCILVFLLLAAGFSGFVTPPHNDDVSMHAFMMKRISETGSALPGKILEEWGQPFNTGWYPTGLHSSIVALSIFSEIPDYAYAFYFVMLLASLLPASIYSLAKRISGNERLAIYASLCVPFIYLLPYQAFSWGGWGLIAAFSFLPLAVSLALKAYQEEEKETLLALGISLAGLFFIHTVELLSVAILFLIFALESRKMPNLKLARSALFAFVPFVLLTAPFYPLLLNYSAGAETTKEFSPGNSSFIIGEAGAALNYALNNGVMLVLLVAGAAWFVAKRKYALLVLVLSFLVLYVFFGFVTASEGLFKLLFPWSEPMRILYHVALLAPILCGAGIFLVIERARNLGARKAVTWGAGTAAGLTLLAMLVPPLGPAISFLFPSLYSLGITAAILVVLGAAYVALNPNVEFSPILGVKPFQALMFVFFVLLNAQFILTATQVMHAWADANTGVTSDDLAVFSWAEKNLKEGLVLNDGLNDGGAWLGSLTGAVPVFRQRSDARDDYGNRSYLLNNLERLGNDKKANGIFEEENVHYVYYGSRRLLSRNRTMSLEHLLSSPEFRLLHSEGGAFLFEVASLGLRLDQNGSECPRSFSLACNKSGCYRFENGEVIFFSFPLRSELQAQPGKDERKVFEFSFPEKPVSFTGYARTEIGGMAAVFALASQDGKEWVQVGEGKPFDSQIGGTIKGFSGKTAQFAFSPEAFYPSKVSLDEIVFIARFEKQFGPDALVGFEVKGGCS